MPKYRKKPVVVEAHRIQQHMKIETLEGTMRGERGDWLITGVKGEQYFCKDDIFRRTYDPVDSEAEQALNLLDEVADLGWPPVRGVNTP